MTENEAARCHTCKKKCPQEEMAREIANGRMYATRAFIECNKELEQHRAAGLNPSMIEELKKSEKQAHKIAMENAMKMEEYEALGTVKELSEAMEKQKPKKPVCKPMPYSEEVGFNEEWLCPTCGSYVGHFSEGMSEPEQMEYCNECGQHIARDWSEEE